MRADFGNPAYALADHAAVANGKNDERNGKVMPLPLTSNWATS